MSNDAKSWTVDSNTQASNPGNIQVSWIRWLRLKPKWPSIWAILFLMFVFLTLKVHWGYGVAAILGLVLNVFYWRRLGEHYSHGCKNPAKIVSVNPLMFAAYTDLNTGLGPDCPAIMIVKMKLPLPNPEVGDRLTTVSLYAGPTDAEHWITFEPLPTILATGNKITLDSVMTSIRDESWNKLDRYLEKLETPLKPGLVLIKNLPAYSPWRTKSASSNPNQ